MQAYKNVKLFWKMLFLSFMLRRADARKGMAVRMTSNIIFKISILFGL